MRRILILTLILLLIGGAGMGAYFYFFSNKATVATIPTSAVNLPIAGQSSTTPSTGGSSPASATGGSSSSAPAVVLPSLVQISTGPIVPGEIVFDTKSTTATAIASSTQGDVAVQYIEKETGNVFSYLSGAGTITRINNKTIPGIQSAQWLPNASTAFVQYLSGDDSSTVNTYALSATSSTGFFLPQDLSGLAVSASRLLMLASGVTGSSASLAYTDGSHTSAAFTTPLTATRISFAGKNQYLVFSKPSASLPGEAYIVSSSGHFSSLAGPLNGLVALASPSGAWVLVSYTLNNAMQMELVNVATHAATTLPVATIADKCVWSNDSTALYCGIPTNPDTTYAYPDDWYQGSVSFSDNIWKINIASRYAQLVLNFSQSATGSLDAEALALDPANTTLVFINKNDGSLWSYSL